MRYFQTCLLLLLAAACSGERGRARPPAQAGATAAPPQVRYDQHVFAGGVAPAADSMSNPYANDASSVQAGEQLFGSMNCDGCHGGPPTGFVGPSLVDGRWRYGGADGAVFQSIFYGRPRGMPAYGGLLTTEMIWKLVTYIKSQPVSDDVPTERW